MLSVTVFPSLPEIWAVMGPRFMILLGLTLIDILVGVIVSLILKKFQWTYLMHFVNTDLMPIFGWLVFLLISLIPADLTPAGEILPITADLFYGFLFLSIIGSILGSFKDIGVLSEFFPKIGIGFNEPKG